MDLDRRHAIATTLEYLHHLSNHTLSHKDIWRGLRMPGKDGRKGAALDGSRFKKEFISKGNLKPLHSDFLARLREHAAPYVRKMNPIMRQTYLYAVGDIDTLQTAALSNVFPNARDRLSKEVLEKLSQVYTGVYLFARYRARSQMPPAEKKAEKFITSGVCEILPYDEGEGVVRFKNRTAECDYATSGDFSEFGGYLIPFGEYIFFVGDEGKNTYPLMAAIQQAPKRETYHKGLLLRRAPRGPLFAGNMILMEVPNTDFENEAKKLAERDPFLTDDEFNALFKKDAKIICNTIGDQDGRALLGLYGVDPV